MKSDKLKKIVILLGISGLLGCNSGKASSVGNSEVSNRKVSGMNKLPHLGDPAMIPFKSFQANGVRCIDLSNVPQILENVSGGTYFTSAISNSQLSTVLGLDAGVSLRQSTVNANAVVQMMDSMYNNAKNINIMYMAEQHATIRSPVITGGYTANLTPSANAIIRDAYEVGDAKGLSEEEVYRLAAKQLRMMCGDSFVSSYTTLALLLAKVNLSFDNESGQRAINAALNVSQTSANELLVKVASVASQNKVTGSINLQLTQLGGVPSELFRILAKNGVESDILSCSFSNFKPCQNVLDAVVSYTKDFATQIGSNSSGADYYVVGNPTLNEYSQVGLSSDSVDDYGDSIAAIYNIPESAAFNMNMNALPSAKAILDNLTSDISILNNYLAGYDIWLAADISPLAQLNGVKTALSNAREILMEGGAGSNADQYGYGALKNPSGDTLNSACFYPSAIYPYEQQTINATKLKNIQALIAASGINSTNPLLGSQCGEYLVSILSQLKSASKGLVRVSFDKGMRYSNDYLNKIQTPPIIVGGEYARYLKDKLYLVPNYFGYENDSSYKLIGGDENSDDIRDSKFLVDIDGAETTSTIKIAGIIKDATIKQFPITINGRPFLGSMVEFLYDRITNFWATSAYQPLAAQDLVIAPMFSDSLGCFKAEELSGGNTYRCLGRDALGVTPLNATENNTAVATFYDLMFRHLELNNYEAYSLSRFDQALAQLNINDLSAESVITNKLKCKAPNRMLLDNYAGDRAQLECVTATDYEHKYAAPHCRYDQLAYKDFKNNKLSGCYPQDAGNQDETRNKIFTALHNLGAIEKVGVDDVLSAKANCVYPNQSVLAIWGQPTTTVFSCKSPSDQQYTSIPRCNSDQLTAYVSKDHSGKGASFNCYPQQGDDLLSEYDYLKDRMLPDAYDKLSDDLLNQQLPTLVSKNQFITEVKKCSFPNQLHFNITRMLTDGKYSYDWNFKCLSEAEVQANKLPICNIAHNTPAKNETFFSVHYIDRTAWGVIYDDLLKCY